MQSALTVHDFNLIATLDSGQVFGFEKQAWGVYQGRIGRRLAKLSQDSNCLYIETVRRGPVSEEIQRYFDLERDLLFVKDVLREEGLDACLKPIWGLRLIQQDAWEALACFIISSNNNIKRIQKIWWNLSQRLSESGSLFPAPVEIARSHERILRELGLGYRAPYLLRAAQFVAVNPESLRVIRDSDYDEARKRLLRFPGIGAKVADCALLYGFQKYEAFPVDTWILRTMRKYYFRNRNVSEERIHAFARKRWGNYAGYIQQYLFHGARVGLI